MFCAQSTRSTSSTVGPNSCSCSSLVAGTPSDPTGGWVLRHCRPHHIGTPSCPWYFCFSKSLTYTSAVFPGPISPWAGGTTRESANPGPERWTWVERAGVYHKSSWGTKGVCFFTRYLFLVLLEVFMKKGSMINPGLLFTETFKVIMYKFLFTILTI